ncbi:hypothetical protein PVK06_035207 [Gossypium arboreum]|uniref:RNase H type-1 domain-containing protein n=1 Tax=Gossypium arboreum TaxID=29729 RepID=A0ABR0NHD5_GOSAR|nr:hypothetical protein PVK06_035207 [Gossypium arboreum]
MMLAPMLHVNPMITAVQWSAPNRGWSKLNTDGAVSLNGSYVAIGGVIKNANANWLWGLSMLLRKIIIFKIEARAILKGLRLAWEKKIRLLEIECDNALLVEMIVVVEQLIVRCWNYALFIE